MVYERSYIDVNNETTIIQMYVQVLKECDQQGIKRMDSLVTMDGLVTKTRSIPWRGVLALIGGFLIQVYIHAQINPRPKSELQNIHGLENWCIFHFSFHLALSTLLAT